MSSSATVSWWQYARWTWAIARNSRITNPTGAEATALRTFVKAIWNPITQTGTFLNPSSVAIGRDWLDTMYKSKSVSGVEEYQGDMDVEPIHVIIEVLASLARDFDNIPIQDVEVTLVDTLIAATGNRRFGTGPLFGGVAGSDVTIP